MQVRGFGKNYFTLAAIQAYSAAAMLHARHIAVAAYRPEYPKSVGEAEEDPPPLEAMLQALVSCFVARPQSSGAKPCHCNCYFKRLAYLLLYISEHFRRFTCRCRYTKTGLAPPFFNEQ
ncbi:hypothetical protein [Hydrogenimonas urashimensis]|uniref:hypothetical protein n=1 Tax=Hydrogenimonas urashimensis TaxID=2740515 RepID=UPI001915C278|nr:hypothetical protein [Hydrogenimonas urashimensis]